MRTYPAQHDIEFGESLMWVPPSGTAKFIVWEKRSPDDSAPRWVQVSGFNIATNSPIQIDGESTRLNLGAGGVAGSWQVLIGLSDGFDAEVAMVTAQDVAGRLLCIDRYFLPAPNSTDAAAMAATERKLLRVLLTQRASLAEVAGHTKVSTPDGTMVERMDFAALDRRVAELRARIVWFDTAAMGNALPRAEFW